MLVLGIIIALAPVVFITLGALQNQGVLKGAFWYKIDFSSGKSILGFYALFALLLLVLYLTGNLMSGGSDCFIDWDGRSNPLSC